MLLAWLAALFALGGAPSARADGAGDARAAQALFEEGRALMDAGRFAEACPKLAESQRLDPGGGTQLNLALCLEGQGRRASALVAMQEALRVAVRDGRADRERMARARVSALERSVARLRVVVPKAAEVEGLVVKLDGEVVGPVSFGVATPIDAGTHTLDAAAPSRASSRVAVTVADGELRDVTVPELEAIRALPAERPAPAAEAPPPAPASATEASAPPPVPHGEMVANPWFYGALALGSAAALTGAVTGAMALSADATAREGCVPERSYCRDDASLAAAERVAPLAWTSTVALAVAVPVLIAALGLPSRVYRPLPPSRVGAAAAALTVGGEW